jgi:hypothetical protein
MYHVAWHCRWQMQMPAVCKPRVDPAAADQTHSAWQDTTYRPDRSAALTMTLACCVAGGASSSGRASTQRSMSASLERPHAPVWRPSSGRKLGAAASAFGLPEYVPDPVREAKVGSVVCCYIQQQLAPAATTLAATAVVAAQAATHIMM